MTPIKLMKNYKVNTLKEFILKNSDLAPQGSAQWLSDRQYIIGGSEMSIITGDNPYSAIDRLVTQKTGLSSFKGNVATSWGKIFEPITTKITEIIFNIKSGIKETGSLPGVFDTQAYSPDGLAVIKMLSDENIYNYYIVLFEFKSPLTTIPSGLIPKHYLPQVKTGLCSIPIADFSLFINNVFRKCRLDQLNDDASYDTNFHNKDEKNKLVISKALAHGVIMFTMSDVQYSNFCTFNNFNKSNFNESNFNESNFNETKDENDMSMLFDHIYQNTDITSKHRTVYDVYNKCSSVKDLGDVSDYEFNNIIELYDGKFITAEYCDPCILSEYNNNILLKAQNLEPGNDKCDCIHKYDISRLTKKDKKEKIICYLPWKLFKSDIIYQEREVGYVLKYKSLIDSTIDNIKKINKCNGIDKSILFKELYPLSKIRNLSVS